MNRDTMAPPIRFVSRLLCMTLAIPLLAACDAGAPAPPPEEPPLAGADIGGPFELKGEDGKTYRWSDFDGQYRIVYFGYAYCPDVCPTDVQRMAQGLNLFERQSPELARQIQPIFITVDPARDTQEVVGEFTDAFHPLLLGLTGTPEQVEAAADVFRVYYQKGADQPGGGYLMDHSNFTFLFGPDGAPLATLPTDLGPEAVAEELAKWVR